MRNACGKFPILPSEHCAASRAWRVSGRSRAWCTSEWMDRDTPGGSPVHRSHRLDGFWQRAAAYQQLAEARPNRPAQESSQRRAAVVREVDIGRLDGPSVEAVLTAAGHRTRRRRQSVAGLTAREME